MNSPSGLYPKPLRAARADSTTARGEPSWHRQARRRRAADRLLLRQAAARRRLEAHHGSAAPMPKGEAAYGGSEFMGALFNLVAAAKGGWAGGGKSKSGRGKGKGKGAEGKGWGDKGKGQGKSGYLHAAKFDPEWPCPLCGPGEGTRNRQARTHCRSCGAPRPKDNGLGKGGGQGPNRTIPASTRPMGVDGRRPALGCRDSSWRNETAAAAELRAQHGPAAREAEPRRREPMGRGTATACGLRGAASYATVAAGTNPAGKIGTRSGDEETTGRNGGFTVVDYGKGARPRVGRFAPLAEDIDDDGGLQEDETKETIYHDMADQGEQQQQQHQQHRPIDDDDQCYDDYGAEDGDQDHDVDVEDDETQDVLERAREELEHRKEIYRCTRDSKGRNHPATIRTRDDVQNAEKKLAEARGPRKWWIQVRKDERRLEAIGRAEDRLE